MAGGRSGNQGTTAIRTLTLAAALILGYGCGATGQLAEEERSLGQPGTLVVRENAHLPKGRYLRPAVGEGGRDGVIALREVSGLTLDLRGAELRGARPTTRLDNSRGFGIVIEDCHNVVVRGGTIGGYRVCVAVRRSSGVVLEDMNFEGWFAQRLGSTPFAEDASDWLRPHENDHDEWINHYGAAISFTDCHHVIVRRCRGRHGQNGILLTRTRTSQVYDNDFSFLSGWGLGMYRSSGNTISHNIFDYCVRGYSHEIYSRGQDSAGILLFERCSDNVVAYNSATHCGDGVFLYAGQDLVEGRAIQRGEKDPGGSDRNLFYKNDLRHSPANGLEATFSKENLVVKNRLSDCAQHGIWGGYSSRMLVFKNEITGCQGGVTIEHGQECVIAANHFRNNRVAVELYWDPDPSLVQGPLGHSRDTTSRDHFLVANVFQGNQQDLVLKKTSGVTLMDNRWSTDSPPLRHMAPGTLRPAGGPPPDLLVKYEHLVAPRVPGTQLVGAEERGVATGDRSTIVMGPWGPWDYRSGEPRPPRRPLGGLLANQRWQAVWFRWGTDADPRLDLARWRRLAAHPVLSRSVGAWRNPWGDPAIKAAIGTNHFGLVAHTRLDLRPGRYRLSVVSDDGVRVLVDGKIVFEDRTWHAPRRGQGTFEIQAGPHKMTLEYFQIDGATALILDLAPT